MVKGGSCKYILKYKIIRRYIMEIWDLYTKDRIKTDEKMVKGER